MLGLGTTGVFGLGLTGGLIFGFTAAGGFGLGAEGGLGLIAGGGLGLPWVPPGAGAGAPGSGAPAGPLAIVCAGAFKGEVRATISALNNRARVVFIGIVQPWIGRPVLQAYIQYANRANGHCPLQKRMGWRALFHVTFEDNQQVAKLLLAFARIRRFCDAFVGVLMDDNLGKGLQRFSSRNNLRQDFDAITVVLNHLFDGLQLADDFSQANLQSSFLRRPVNMLGGSHPSR